MEGRKAEAERQTAKRWRSAIQTQPRAVIGCSGVWADVHVFDGITVLRRCPSNTANRHDRLAHVW